MKKDFKKKRLKEKMFNKLSGKRKFLLQWSEYVGYSVEVEAKDEAEAQKKWENGETGKPDIEDTEMQDDSLIVEEIE